MADSLKSNVPDTEEKALEGIAVSPPAPDSADSDVGSSTGSASPMPEVREAMDAEDDDTLRNDPSNADAKLDVALDETFPTSDAPSNTRPGNSGEPAPSSGFDEEAEAKRAKQ